MSPTTPFVRALVVTHGRSEFLAETLASLAAQSRPVDSAFVVVSGRALEDDDDIVVPPGFAVEIVRVKGSTFGKAVDALLGTVEEREGEWLWLLHDDSAPAPDALEHLLAQAAKRRLAGIVGAAQVRWDDPTRLVNIGTTVSRRGARRLSFAEGDDLDQGQHYEMEDVLAVGLAGAIVTRGVWTRLGGTDPAYGRFGDSADFCRRAWRAGYDVVIAPRARVRHAQGTLTQRATPADAGGDARATHASRRAAEWYHALAWAPAWRGPLLFAWCIVSSLARAALRLTASDLRLVAAELRVPLLLWARVGRLPASRAAIRRVSKGGERVEDPLLATAGDVFRFLRTRELGAFEAWRAESRPSDVQHRELAALATRRRWTLGGLAAFMLAIAVALFGTWYAPLARGEALAGAALGTTDVSTAELWLRTFTGWSEAGLGSGSLDGGFAALMLPLSLVPGGFAMGVGLLLLLSPLLAAISAWFAAGAATRSLVARTLAAVFWGVWPGLVESASDGRVGAVIVHLVLPLFALAVARSIGIERRDRLADGAVFPTSRLGSPSAAAVASLALAVITVASPALLLPLVLVVVVVALSSTVQWRFAFTIPLPALVLQGPALAAAWHGWRSPGWFSPLVREDGPALASAPASGWDLLWGVAQHPPVWPGFPGAGTVVLTYGAGVLLIGAALAALASGRSAGAVASGWALALVGLSVAVVSGRTMSVVAGPDGQEVANGWAGPGLSLMALGLLCAACAAAPAGWTPGVAWRARPLRAVAGALVIGVLAVHVAGEVWPGRAFGGDVHPSVPTVLPLVATLELQSQPISRSLVLWQDDAGLVRYTVESRDGSTTLTGRGATTWPAAPEDVADSSVLAPAIGILAGGGEGAADMLVAWGISSVVVAPGSPALESQLLRSPELSLIGASDLGRSWRVKTRGGVPAARAWIETDLGDRVPLPSTPVGLTATLPRAASGTVILAVPADARWSATLDGRALATTEADGRQAFALDGDGGKDSVGDSDDRGGVLRVAYYDSAYRAWWWAGVVALLWAVASSVPLHDRRFVRPST